MKDKVPHFTLPPHTPTHPPIHPSSYDPCCRLPWVMGPGGGDGEED